MTKFGSTMALSAFACSALLSPAAVAQESSYYLTSHSNHPQSSHTGGFVTVCIEPDDGLPILKERVSDLRWGTGVSKNPRRAVEQLPYFVMPLLVTAECLEETLTAYKDMFNRDDLTVRALE